MIPRRLTALVLGLSIVAAACGGADLTQAVGNESSGVTPPDGIAIADLASPTEATTPLDLTGGVTSVANDDLVDLELTALAPELAQATSPWPTDWTRRSIELDEFVLGIQTIDPRDRIRPIDTPRFEPIDQAGWLGEREPGALVQFNDETRFYPLSILTRHEIVNDRFGDIPVVISYCPLCNTAITFDARVDGQALRFGVSGLLRNSDLVMWDDATTSLWQQITGEAVVGRFAGTSLDKIPTSLVSYGDVLENFPEALSLSRLTGFDIDYGANGYRDYSSSGRPFLFDGELDDRFPALSRVVGVSVGSVDKSFPFDRLRETGVANDVIAGHPVAVLLGGDTADALDTQVIAEGEAIGSGIAYSAIVDNEVLTFSRSTDDLFVDDQTGSTWTLLGIATDGPHTGKRLETVDHRNEFWFAWAAFFPDAPVYGDDV
jgi:hypothetical protein